LQRDDCLARQSNIHNASVQPESIPPAPRPPGYRRQIPWIWLPRCQHMPITPLVGTGHQTGATHTIIRTAGLLEANRPSSASREPPLVNLHISWSTRQQLWLPEFASWLPKLANSGSASKLASLRPWFGSQTRITMAIDTQRRTSEILDLPRRRYTFTVCHERDAQSRLLRDLYARFPFGKKISARLHHSRWVSVGPIFLRSWCAVGGDLNPFHRALQYAA